MSVRLHMNLPANWRDFDCGGKRSDDIAFARRAATNSARSGSWAKSGVALRFPPQSKTATVVADRAALRAAVE